MTLADRMNHLGTETAFEVLAKARALESPGEGNRPPGNRGAGLRHPPAYRRSRNAGPPGWPDPLRAHTRHSPAQGGHRPQQQGSEGHRHRPRPRGGSPPGAKPIMFYVILALAEPGVEVIYPNPGIPHLRIHDPVLRGHPGPHAVDRGEELSSRPGGSGVQDH